VGFHCGLPLVSHCDLPLWATAVRSRCGLRLWESMDPEPQKSVGRCGLPLWSPAVISRCGLPLWASAVGPRWYPAMWCPAVVSRCGLPLWAPAGLPLWFPVVGSRCWIGPRCGLPLGGPFRKGSPTPIPQKTLVGDRLPSVSSVFTYQKPPRDPPSFVWTPPWATPLHHQAAARRRIHP
jgi:hypothetical protein